jgi:hypothetical protein
MIKSFLNSKCRKYFTDLKKNGGSYSLGGAMAYLKTKGKRVTENYCTNKLHKPFNELHA